MTSTTSGRATSVAIVSHDVGVVSGMERQVALLVDGLADRGLDVHVVSRTCRVQRPERVTHHRVAGPVRPFPVGFPWFSVAAARTVRRLDVDVVQVTGCLARVDADVVAIHYLHASATAALDATLSSGSALHRLNQRIAARQFRAAERRQLDPRHHREVTAVSSGLADDLRRHYPAAREPRIIGNGIDVERFSPGPVDPAVRAELAPPGVTSLAVFVGGGWTEKGLDPAIEALVSAPGWGLSVVGPGEPGPFLDRARRLGVADRLRFCGRREDLPAVYRAADALVLPSAYETFSLVAHEAAVAGCPVVATPVHGITDFLVDGVSGLQIDATAASIGDALRRLGSMDADARRAMVERARAHASRHTVDAMVDAHVALFQELRARRT